MKENPFQKGLTDQYSLFPQWEGAYFLLETHEKQGANPLK